MRIGYSPWQLFNELTTHCFHIAPHPELISYQLSYHRSTGYLMMLLMVVFVLVFANGFPKTFQQWKRFSNRRAHNFQQRVFHLKMIPNYWFGLGCSDKYAIKVTKVWFRLSKHIGWQERFRQFFVRWFSKIVLLPLVTTSSFNLQLKREKNCHISVSWCLAHISFGAEMSVWVDYVHTHPYTKSHTHSSAKKPTWKIHNDDKGWKVAYCLNKWWTVSQTVNEFP